MVISTTTSDVNVSKFVSLLKGTKNLIFVNALKAKTYKHILLLAVIVYITNVGMVNGICFPAIQCKILMSSYVKC